MVVADSLAVASAPIALTALLSIASFVSLVTLVALCACCKCCHRPLKEEDLEAYGVSGTDGHAPVVQFRDGKKSAKGRHSSEKLPKSALKKSTRAESVPTDPSTTLLHSASTRRALPSLPSEMKSPSSLTRDSSTSDLYASVDKQDKQGNSIVAVVHDWKSETESNTTRTTVARTSMHRLQHGVEQQQQMEDQPPYARIPPRHATYDTIDADSDLTDPLYSKVDTMDTRPFRYEYPPFAAKAQTQTGKRGEHLYQRVDDDGSQIYAGGSEDPYSSISSEVGGAKRMRTIDDDDDDDESSAYEPGYARVTGKPKESSVDDAPGPSFRPVPVRNVDHLYTKINRHSAPVSDDFSSDRRPPSPPPPPLPDNRDRRPRSEQPDEEAIREPSYRYITVRESLDVLRARMAHQQREQGERMQQQSGPVREHYYSTIGSEHGYEVVPNRSAHQPLYEDVLNNGAIDGDAHRYDVVPPAGPSASSLPPAESAPFAEQESSGLSTPRRSSIPPPIPPTSPIPERTPPKTEPSSRVYSRSTTGDFTTASEESRGADSFYSIERDDLPPKRPNDPLVRGMAAVGQGAGELIDRGLALIARSVSTGPTGAASTAGTEVTAAGGQDMDSSLELSWSPLPADRTDEAGTGQGMPAQQRYPPASHQRPLSSLTTASAPLAPNGQHTSHPPSSQVTSSACRNAFSDVDRWAASVQQQARADHTDDIYNVRRPAPEAVFPENLPLDSWKKRSLAREDSDQSFVTAPTSANDVVNGRNGGGGRTHFELGNSPAASSHSAYRELITSKQSSEESSDQETDPACTARQRDWSESSGGRATESTDKERIRAALRTRTESQESSSGVSGSLDTETKTDDNRTSRELIDDGTLHADGGRSSRNGRQSAASANSENMHDSGMFAASFIRGNSQNSAQNGETPRADRVADQTSANKVPSVLTELNSPETQTSKIPVLVSKGRRDNSPIHGSGSTHHSRENKEVGATDVGVLQVGFRNDENGFSSAKNIPADILTSPTTGHKSFPTNTSVEEDQWFQASSIKPPTSLRALGHSSFVSSGNKSADSFSERSGGPPSGRLNFRPVFEQSPTSPEDSVLSSHETFDSELSNAGSSTFATSGMSSSLGKRNRADSSLDAHTYDTAIVHGRKVPRDEGGFGGLAAQDRDKLSFADKEQSVPSSNLRTAFNDGQRGAAVDARRWPPNEPLSVDISSSPSGRRKVETRDYISPVDLSTDRAWPLQTTDSAEERRDVSPDRAMFVSGLADPDPLQSYERLTSTPMIETRAETTDSGECDGTCYCHSAMPVQERVWDENLYEMDKVRWGENRASSSEESTKSIDKS